MKEEIKIYRKYNPYEYPDVHYPQNLLMDIFTPERIKNPKTREQILNSVTKETIEQVASVMGATHLDGFKIIFQEFYKEEKSTKYISEKYNMQRATINHQVTEFLRFFINPLAFRMLIYPKFLKKCIQDTKLTTIRVNIKEATIIDLLMSGHINMRLYNVFKYENIKNYMDIYNNYNKIVNIPGVGDTSIEKIDTLLTIHKAKKIYYTIDNRDLCKECIANKNNGDCYLAGGNVFDLEAKSNTSNFYKEKGKLPQCAFLRYLHKYNGMNK